MWPIARLLISFGALVYRLFFRRTPSDYDCLHGDLPYAERVESAKGRPGKRFFETPVDSAFICVLSKETALDRFFKAIGFGEELQTADAAFDKLVYVLGDHPLTKAYLTSRPTARMTILKLFNGGAVSIWITGKSLQIEVPDSFDSTSALDDLATLARELQAVQGDVRSRFADPYYDTALIIQAVVLALIVYALLGTIESFDATLEHSYFEPVIGVGLLVTSSFMLVAGGFMLASVGGLWLLLRRSSFAPRLITENCILIVPLAFAGFQVASDVNRTWDRSQGWIVSYRVDDLRKVYHTRILGGSYYTYHARISVLSPTTSYPIDIPRRLNLRIGYGQYAALSVNKQLNMEIGEGALGFPYCREIWAGSPEP